MKRLLFYLFLLSASGCHRSTEFTVRFRNAHGLAQNAPVMYAGTNVGTVLSVSPISDGVDATISMSRDTPLYREAQYVIESKGTQAVVSVRDAGKSRTPIRQAEVLEGSEPVDLTVRFGELHGLRVGARVIYRGIPIGSVTTITTADDGVDVKINAVLDNGTHLYRELTYRNDLVDGQRAIVVTGNGTTVVQAGETVRGTSSLKDSVSDVAGRAADSLSRLIDGGTQ